MEGATYLENGAPFEYAKLLYRGDRYEFPITAVRDIDHSTDRPGNVVPIYRPPIPARRAF